jgi:hypothetical protein
LVIAIISIFVLEFYERRREGKDECNHLNISFAKPLALTEVATNYLPLRVFPSINR